MAKKIVGKSWAYLGVAGALILAVCGLTGCQTTGDDKDYARVPGLDSVTNAPDGGEPPVPDQGPKSDTVVHVGDVLIVNFTDTPQPLQPMEARVQDDGTIKLYYNERFKASDKVISQLEQEVHEAYVPKYFMRVTVTITPKENYRFYVVGGEVRQPGQKLYISRITLTQAIEGAGGFTDFAKKRDVKLIHPNGKIEHINAKKALKDPRFDRPIYPNDTIHVDRSIW
jgi:polysaccharide export outer membrane protein